MTSFDNSIRPSSDKTSVKWLDVPIERFNAAVPHFVDRIKNHSSNLVKLKRLSQWEEMRKEQSVAARAVTQLSCLLADMDNLRSQIVESDVPKFDKLVAVSKHQALTTINSFKAINVESEMSWRADDEAMEKDVDAQEQMLYAVAAAVDRVREQERVATSVERLHEDVQDLNSMFQDLTQLLHEQGEDVARVEEEVVSARDNVVEGEKSLRQAVKYKYGVYPLVGALLGSVVGGPIGLVAGLKLGSLSAVGGGLLGFTGGKLLVDQNQKTVSEANEHSKKVDLQDAQDRPECTTSTPENP